MMNFPGREITSQKLKSGTIELLDKLLPYWLTLIYYTLLLSSKPASCIYLRSQKKLRLTLQRNILENFITLERVTQVSLRGLSEFLYEILFVQIFFYVGGGCHVAKLQKVLLHYSLCKWSLSVVQCIYYVAIHCILCRQDLLL